MKMKDDSFKRQLWITGTIIGFVLIASIVALLYFSGDLDSRVHAILKAKQELADRGDRYSDLAHLRETAVEAARYEMAMDRLLGSQDSVISFPSQVIGLGKANGVSANFSFKGNATPAKENEIGFVGFNLSVTGPLDNLLAFLKDFEITSPILLSVLDTFDFSQSGANYTMASQGRVFFK